MSCECRRRRSSRTADLLCCACDENNYVLQVVPLPRYKYAVSAPAAACCLLLAARSRSSLTLDRSGGGATMGDAAALKAWLLHTVFAGFPDKDSLCTQALEAFSEEGEAPPRLSREACVAPRRPTLLRPRS